MNILLITTGGTIASVIGDGVIGVTHSGRLLVLEKYREIDTDTSFDLVSPMNILSENITTQDYKTLVETLRSADMSKYDGVIITHGSDTLAYTSALVGLLFEDTEIPIALVASDKPLDDENSNGMDNFICAVKLIKDATPGVFVPYKNSDGVTYIHRGVCLLESTEFSNDFHSVKKSYAVFENGEILKSGASDFVPQLCKEKVSLDFSKKVLVVYPYPDIDYSCYDISSVKAVLHRSYHAGSVCANDKGDSSIISLIERCKNENVPFYICGVKNKKADYESLSDVIERGAKVMYDVSPASAYMKLMLED